MAGGIPLIRPLRESLVGERITRVMGIVNGTTNFILTRMTEAGRVVRRRPGRGAEPGLRRARPHRRRRGVRRRRQGGDHRRDRVRRASRRGRRVPRGHQRHHRRRHRVRGAARLRREAARHRRALDGEIGVRVHPAMVPVQPPAGQRCASVQRRVHRGRRGGRAHVLRPRRRGSARPRARCSAT